MITIERPWGSVRLAISDCNVPPDRVGCKGNLYLNSTATWISIDGEGWRRVINCRGTFKTKCIIETATSYVDMLDNIGDLSEYY